MIKRMRLLLPMQVWFSKEIKKAFDPEYMEEEEPQTEAQKLMARLDNPSNQQA